MKYLEESIRWRGVHGPSQHSDGIDIVAWLGRGSR